MIFTQVPRSLSNPWYKYFFLKFQPFDEWSSFTIWPRRKRKARHVFSLALLILNCSVCSAIQTIFYQSTRFISVHWKRVNCVSELFHCSSLTESYVRETSELEWNAEWMGVNFPTEKRMKKMNCLWERCLFLGGILNLPEGILDGPNLLT